MAMGKLTIFLLQLSWTVHLVTGIQRKDIFPYGTLSGDFTLQEGDDETSKVLALKRPLYFYEAQFNELYVATNGIISAQDLPMEKQYVDDGFPTDFPVIAPFLADIDTSKGKGAIYYRVTESPTLLNRVAQEVHRGFPDGRFTPTHAVIATWENVAAYEEVTRATGPSDRLNTFQAVVAYDENDSYALFLYPEDGLHFFGTRPKESYNVEIELPARVGFSRGEVSFIFSRMEGPYYSVTSNEQSLKNLYQVGNTGVSGVWLFHIGNRYSFENVVPAAVGGALATPPPRGQEGDDSTTAEYPEVEYHETFEEEEPDEDYPPIVDPDFQSPTIPEFLQPSHPDHGALPDQARLQSYGGDLPLTSDPQYREHDNHGKPPPASSPSGPGEYPAEYPAREPESRNQPHQPPLEDVQQQQQLQPQAQAPQVVPRPEHTVLEVFPNNRRESSPRMESSPPLAPGGGHFVSVVEEEDVDFDTGVIQYSTETKETCARFQQQCSQNAYCTDYSSGFCCLCRSGFYGNGRHCLPDGAPHRVNGKVSGTVIVGSTPVDLNSVDLHAYIVVGDGRAYTAISEVPEPVGWALMPVAPIGELFGWLFALELPNSQAGFKITGAEFTRHAEVTFYPGNQRLSIVQTAQGLDSENHLSVDTRLYGDVPFIAPGATVQVEPYKETYQYYPSVVRSTSVRQFTVVSAERGSETFTFQLHQNITYRDCRYGPRVGPETLQLTTERVFVMYVKEENILRYAITNKISPVGVEPSEPAQVNPCYSGTHDCDTTAQCLPREGQQYQCQCATGYRGDGHNCYDVDECVEGLTLCGAHAQCFNLPGSHRCQCQSGYEFGFDGRTCIDVDECVEGLTLCGAHAQCFNLPGSHRCQCQSGYEFGFDGRTCIDVDECVEGLTLCGAHAQCFNLPGSHRCQCQSGYEFGFDGRTCIDLDECRSQPCHPQATCSNTLGSFQCQCQHNFQGDGFQCVPSNGHPERPKTQCEQHRDSLLGGLSPRGPRPVPGGPAPGAFVPQCDEQGQYRALQCHSSTGHCWCVDNRGQERAGTRTLPRTSPTNCDGPDRPERPKTHCEHHRDSVQTTSPEGYPILEVFVPQCDEQGQYRALQCHGSTGHCWCVDNRGQERAGTRKPPGTGQPNCDETDRPERPKTQCEQYKDRVQTTSPEGYPIVGVFVPECDEQGQYRALQCHGSTGHCWCVDSRGQERAGTRKPPGTGQPNCDETDRPERPKTQCEQYKDRVQTTSPEGYPIVGVFVPECDEQGQYRALQCHSSTGHCWCVDSRGQERAGTRKPPGTSQPNCDETDRPERPKTQCEQYKDRVQTTSPEGYPILGVFVPECDEQGQYRALQCHGSTGHCWCVDSRGQERAGTRKPPGTSQPNCDETDRPERPKTQCEQYKDRVQTTSPEGYPIVGVFVPECDEQGQYRALQCHGSTGHCWCVDSRGQERAGTRKGPGTGQPNCNEPDHPERPKTQCEHQRDSLQTTIPEGNVGGAFVPQCDEQGQYRALQCHGSTGHCWCVDSRGQERAGTRKPPGTSQPNCDEPAVVPPTQRPETVCERWRASLVDHYGGKPEPHHYLPQCDPQGQFNPIQCYGDSSYCWCVDRDGREVAGTRSHDVVKPACIPTVAPPTMHPLPRPDVTPPPSGTSLLYAQGQQIGALPLNGTLMDSERSSTLLALHGSIVVGIDYDCREKKVYWTDLAGRTINRAKLEPGADPETLINTGLTSPEGLAVDVVRRAMFWVDSTPDKIERANLDGSGRQTLFDTDMVNPRAIIVDSSTGTLYWTDWNREAPKIESSSVDGHSRKVLVKDGIGLPNALTFDTSTRQVCWADAGTKRLECIASDGTGRRVIHSNLNYPFSMVFYANHFYFTDWRRDGVIALSRDSSQFTDEYLPDQRSHLYGVTVATTHCL
ncbi:nidogen-2 isoform X1 [Coregonus clupeaformis]|uniref:nidogen-2 isoform X1 n=1 Tax=Coregonus clupeaformis TaxID=59861 RepID=UPI001BDF7F73|nr:nidogen-2 isoform X1 [Coregonus clupeaformis]